MILFVKLANFIAKTEFARDAMNEKADLSEFRERPSKRVLWGIGLLLFSYVIGWPVIALLGYISLNLNEPLIIVIGAPVQYGISHAVFCLGVYLAGSKYSKIFFKWAVRSFISKYSGEMDY